MNDEIKEVTYTGTIQRIGGIPACMAFDTDDGRNLIFAVPLAKLQEIGTRQLYKHGIVTCLQTLRYDEFSSFVEQ